MKITAVETILLKIPYENGGKPWNLTGKPWSTLDILMVRVETADGASGWGEAFGHAVIEGTKATLDSLIAPALIGRDATAIGPLTHELRQKLHLFGTNGPVTYGISGVDIALWDLAGKRAGQPLHQLLGGGARTTLPAYASLMRYGEPEIVARNAARAIEQGYRAIKLHEIDIPQVAAAREAIGPEIALMLDTNCPWSVGEAMAMAQHLQPYDLFWLEEPVWPPNDHEGLAKVRATGTRIAAGENAAGLVDFRHIFAAGAVDFAQPSVTKIGGVTEMMKVIALAEAQGVTLVPHCAYFGAGFLASLHIAATLPRAVPFERIYMDLEASPYAPLTEAQDGTLRVPEGPGLGCDPDPAVIARYRTHPPSVIR
jgi:L-alanine-DL-glutamate epimerase-like enolase superfamily enzyme